jgi:sec-independent protein translocase protein TatA
MINPLIGMPQGAEWLVILAIVILVFGAAKLPDLARGTGQALRIFKSETKGLKDDEAEDEAKPGRNDIATPPAELPGSPVEENPTAQDRQPDTRNG